MGSKTKEQKAEQYAKEQNSCYTNDYYGFLAGYEQALKDMEEKSVNKGVKYPNCKSNN